MTKHKSACRLLASKYDIAKRQSIMQTITLVKQLLYLRYHVTSCITQIFFNALSDNGATFLTDFFDKTLRPVRELLPLSSGAVSTNDAYHTYKPKIQRRNTKEYGIFEETDVSVRMPP
mmetsp:Transcript_14844/g.21074  ORF Transcript_14844/g.21074 Transcript_14844/m.21074 type:complete len:118 (-) Transcript_14844:464-817(-)